MWSDGSSYSYNPGWIGSQPTTNTNQVIVIMITRFDDCGEDDDGVGCGLRNALRETFPLEINFQNCVVFRDTGKNIGKWQHVGCSKTVGDNINFVCERKTECGYNNNIGWAGKK